MDFVAPFLLTSITTCILGRVRIFLAATDLQMRHSPGYYHTPHYLLPPECQSGNINSQSVGVMGGTATGGGCPPVGLAMTTKLTVGH
ncbi:hypothetical protein K7X08_015114 [Anisodus acutangulus]|uniref:Uncharacterized protein n=1 Tax=Anisodus acutangulus TaxID=402998 RepID=A0A9Q1L363_9SOLA|nr:hypothetical protein K7X08_015114 [Anisodus acutangulus]